MKGRRSTTHQLSPHYSYIFQSSFPTQDYTGCSCITFGWEKSFANSENLVHELAALCRLLGVAMAIIASLKRRKIEHTFFGKVYLQHGVCFIEPEDLSLASRVL